MSQIEKISRVLTPQPVPIATAPDDDWLDVQAIYRVIRRRIGLITIVAAVIVLLALPLIMAMERAFSASTRILIHDPLPAALSTTGLVSETELNLTTEGERLLSRDIAVRVIESLGLKDKPEFNADLRVASPLQRVVGGLRALLPGGSRKEVGSADPLAHIIPEYLGRLTIWRSPGSEVVNIGFTSRDPELAAMVPNTLVHTYLEERGRQFAARFTAAEAWLADRVAEQEQRLARAVAAVDTAKAVSEPVLRTASGTAEMIARFSETRTGIARAEAELASDLAALRNAGGLEARAEVTDSEAVAGLRHDLEVERANLGRLRDRYGAAHEDVIASEKRITDLDDRLATEVGREERKLQARLAALQQEKARIEDSLTTAQTTFAQMRQAETDLGQLQRVVDNEQTALDSLGTQFRALKAEAQLPATEVEVLSPATVPLVADGKGRVYYLAIALFAATAIALTTAFLVEMIDKSVRSHEQLRNIAPVRAAGLVPALSKRLVRRFWEAYPASVSPAYSDAVQGVILALEQRGDGVLPQSILVTSALPGEGKTTLAAALAAELAAAGRSVLLVDADLRHGRLCERFGRTDATGFNAYLAGKTELGDLQRHAMARNLSLLARGDAPAQRGLDRTRIKDLIRAANRDDQIVIFDGAPALVSNEALLLAGVVSRTVLLVRWGKTDRRSVEAAVDRLSPRHDDGIDVVIGQVNLKRQALYGYRDAGLLAQALRRYHADPG